MIIGILSCENKESSKFDKLVDGTWTLETTPPVLEYLDLKEDMTYKITGLISNPVLNNGVAVETGSVTGEWNLEDNKITFLTTHVELNTNYFDIDIPMIDDQQQGSFLGYQVEGIFNNSNTDWIMRGDTASLDLGYSPTVWIIEELTEKSLIVTRGTKTIKYDKQ